MTTPHTSICKLTTLMQLNLKEHFQNMHGIGYMVDVVNGNQVLFEHLMVDFYHA